MHETEKMVRESVFSHRTKAQEHPMKLIGNRFRTNKRKDFFNQLVIKLLNSVPVKVMMATDVDGFMEARSVHGY